MPGSFPDKNLLPDDNGEHDNPSDNGDGEDVDEDLSSVSGPSTKCPTKQTRPKLTKKQKREEKEDAIMNKALECIGNLGTARQPITEDDCDIFSRHVAAELKQITDLQSRGYVKFRINQLIYELCSPVQGMSQQTPVNTNSETDVGTHSTYMVL